MHNIYICMNLMKLQHASCASKVLNLALFHSLNVPQKKTNKKNNENLSILHVIEISHCKKKKTKRVKREGWGGKQWEVAYTFKENKSESERERWGNSAVSSDTEHDLPVLWAFQLQLVVPVVTLGSICCDKTRRLYLHTIMQLYFIKVYNSSSLAAGGLCERVPAPLP